MRLDELLPAGVDGWTPAGDDEVYDRETIFDYMNGAGEIYLAYDFRRMLVREYTRESGPPIVAEVYEMSSSEDAYGIFTHDTDGDPVSLGQGAFYAAGLVRFWKDRIFARVIAEKETDEAAAAVMSLGTKITEAVPGEGNEPRLVACLPSGGLLKESVRFFHKQVSLNCHYYLADSNILNLGEKTEAVLARYRVGDGKVRLLVVRYRTAEDAQAAYEQFVQSYFSDEADVPGPIHIHEVEGAEFAGARLVDRFVTLVFEAGDEETCERLIESVAQRTEKVFQWEKDANSKER